MTPDSELVLIIKVCWSEFGFGSGIEFCSGIEICSGIEFGSDHTLWSEMMRKMNLESYNLFVTSKNELSNSRIQSAAYKSKSLLKPPFNGVLVLNYYFKKHFKPCYFFLF